VLRGGGEMGALMRAVNWSKTRVGAVETWPQSLKTTLSILLESKFGTMVAWGPAFTHFYNDAYRPILGSTKHPSLGQRVPDVFPEIWGTIGPLFDQVMQGTAIGFDDLLVPLDRHGYLEEIYFTFSYTPIRDEAGAVGGVLVTVAETTMRLIQERRLRTLRDLALRTAQAGSESQVWLASAEALSSNDADVPFALFYVLGSDGLQLTLAASTAEVAPSVSPAQVRLDGADDEGWPVGSVLTSNEARLVTDIEARFGAQRGRRWPEPIQRALILPIRGSGTAAAYGVLVMGISPRRELDDDYRAFCGLVADQIAAAVANSRARAEERRRTEALAEIDRAKTAFFSNVSHEFRTPLTLMLGPLKEAIESPHATLGGEDLRAVHRNSLRLLKLVNALLDFSRTEAGTAQVNPRPTDLATLTRDVASAFHSTIERGGLAYEVDCPSLPSPVLVDRDMWETIVLNLLSNAFKFTLAGTIRVELRQVGQDVRLVVRDTGVGIPASDVPHVFERFRTVPGANGRTQEGSGIGLALVQELVQLHRGHVTVESRLGQGTVFTVSLPADRGPTIDRQEGAGGHAGAAMSEAYVVEALRWLAGPADAAGGGAAVERQRVDSPAATPAARAAHVLLADDNADMREYITRLLAHRWTVQAVADGAQALAAVRQRRPDLVVTDVMMPNVGGFELLGALRSDPQTADIPIIMLSARAGEESRVEGLQSGADDYLAKPFSSRELVARVTTHLELGRLRRQAEIERKKLYDQFMQAPVPMSLVVGPDLVFELANQPYLEMIGRADVVGKSMRAVFAELPADAPIFQLLHGVYESGRPFTADEYCVPLDRNGDGQVKDVFFRFTCQPMRDASGAIEGLMTAAIDITPQVNARAQAELASRAKDDFLAVLGHELRNPLAPIVTALRLMQMKGLRVDELAIMERQVGALERLVDDLMDVSRITQGKIELRKSRVELSGVVLRALETASPMLEQRRHRIDLQVPVEGLQVDGDPDRLSQVISNLLTNAAKYSDPGSEIHLVADHFDGRARLRIRDHGIGIPAEMLTQVFEMFVQPQARDRAKGGVGLGLAIVRSLVELHQGKVWASSEGPGTGSEFVVVLPLAPGPDAANYTPGPRRRHPAANLTGAGPARILIVDDNEDAAQTLAEFLTDLGHEVRTAHDGPSAIDVAGAFRPTICLVDISMPVMDGYEVAQRLRQLDGLPRNLRLMAVTGYGQETDRRRSREAGFDDHLVKPVDLELLVRSLPN
jgi:signal transduction histidine kinase/ActR/RegA family two-component response regulator